MDQYLDIEVYKQLKRDFYKESYYEFYKDAFKALKPNEVYSDNWHIKYLCDVLQEELFRINRREQKQEDLIINVPVRSSKSLIISVIFPVWCWISNPYLKFMCVSNAQNLANDLSVLSKDLIESEWFREYFEDHVKLSSKSDAKELYANNKGGTRKSMGRGANVIGFGGDIIIVDDLQDAQKALSEVERKSTLDYYSQSLYNRLNQPDLGLRIIVMQRLHIEDLTGYLLSNFSQFYRHICIPVDIKSQLDKENVSPKELQQYYTNDLFWPDRFNERMISEYTISMTERGAAGQLYQRPVLIDGNIVKKEWFDIIDAENLALDLINHPINFYLDTAETEKQEGDATGIVGAFKKDNCVYIVIAAEIRKEFFDLVRYIPEFVSLNRYTQNSKIKIEPKSSGKSIVSQLRSTTMLNIIELPSPKDSKLTRMNAITPLLESRRVKIIRGNFNSMLLDQLTVFPNGSYDDVADAFIHCVHDLLMQSDFDFDFI